MNNRSIFICNDSQYFLLHRRGIADELAEMGHDVLVVTGGEAIPSGNRGNWRYVNVNIRRFNFNLVADLVLFFRSLWAFLQHRPRYAQLITLKPAVFSGLAAMAARLVGRGPECVLVTIPGLGRLMTPDASLNCRGRVARRLVGYVISFLAKKRGVRFSFETIGDREYWLKQGYIKEKTSFLVTGAGVNPNVFYPAKKNQLDGGAMRVLFASRLLRSKGLDVFVEAARGFSARSDIQFTVAGMVSSGDPDTYPIEQLAEEATIRFLGNRVDVAQLLRETDVVCLPTRYGEGVPRILIEAAATGLPCIVSDVHGCTQIVQDEISGIVLPLVPVAEMAGALGNALERYLSSPSLRTLHGNAAKDIFTQGGFSEHEVNALLVELLTSEKIIGSAKSAPSVRKSACANSRPAK